METNDQERSAQDIFVDPDASDNDREHAFIGLWYQRVRAMPTLSRDEMLQILEHAHWQGALNSLIGTAVMYGVISKDDLSWLRIALIDRGLGKGFAAGQLNALMAFHDPVLDLLGKLDAALSNKADWVAQAVIAALPIDQLPAAEIAVNESLRPRWCRHNLRTAIRRRLKLGQIKRNRERKR